MAGIALEFPTAPKDAVGVALFLLARLAERRREFATLIAIGAEPAKFELR